MLQPYFTVWSIAMICCQLWNCFDQIHFMHQQNESLFRWEENDDMREWFRKVHSYSAMWDVRSSIILSGPVFFCNLYTFQYKCHQSTMDYNVSMQCVQFSEIQGIRHPHPSSAVYFYSVSGLGWVAGNLIFSHSQMIS